MCCANVCGAPAGLNCPWTTHIGKYSASYAQGSSPYSLAAAKKRCSEDATCKAVTCAGGDSRTCTLRRSETLRHSPSYEITYQQDRDASQCARKCTHFVHQSRRLAPGQKPRAVCHLWKPTTADTEPEVLFKLPVDVTSSVLCKKPRKPPVVNTHTYSCTAGLRGSSSEVAEAAGAEPPDAVSFTEKYAGTDATPMGHNFSLANGTYEVNVAILLHGLANPESRVSEVEINGKLLGDVCTPKPRPQADNDCNFRSCPYNGPVIIRVRDGNVSVKITATGVRQNNSICESAPGRSATEGTDDSVSVIARLDFKRAVMTEAEHLHPRRERWPTDNSRFDYRGRGNALAVYVPSLRASSATSCVPTLRTPHVRAS